MDKPVKKNQPGATADHGVAISAGRDAIVRDSQISGRDMRVQFQQQYGAQADELAKLFETLLKEVQAATKDDPKKAEAAEAKIGELQDEVAKKDKASDGVMATLIKGLVDLVPGAVSAVAAMFGQPILAAVVGPVTKIVLETLKIK